MLFKIINDIIERAIADFKKEVNTIQNPEDKILCIIENHIKFYVRHRKQTKVLVYERGFLEGEYAKIAAEKELEYVNLIKKVLLELIENYSIEININVATFSLLGMLTWLVRWYDPDGKVTPKVLARNMSTIFLKGLTG